MSRIEENPLNATHELSDGQYESQKSFQRYIFDLAAEFSYPLYRRIYNNREQTVNEYDSRISQANLPFQAEMFLSALIGAGVFAGLAVGGFIAAIIYSTGYQLPLEYLPLTGLPGSEYLITIGTALKFVVFILLGAGIGIAGSIQSGRLYLWAKQYQREREINIVLGDLLSFMYSLSVGGKNQLEIFEDVVDAKETYGEAAVEFERIQRDLKFTDKDYKTAIEDAAEKTPSDELSQFFTDMLSVINSGGDITKFLEKEKNKQAKAIQKKEEENLETLELFGEMYLSMSLLPMMALIILVIMTMMGDSMLFELKGTIYVVIPILNLAYITLISTVQTDNVGSGHISHPDVPDNARSEHSLRYLGAVDQHREQRDNPVFDYIRSRELRYRIRNIFANPLPFFLSKPAYTIPLITGPLLVVSTLFLYATGMFAFSIDGFVDDYFTQTLLYFIVPFSVISLPIIILFEWKNRTKGALKRTLTDDLRKLASTNETGKPLLESMRIVSNNSTSQLGNEFEHIYKRVQFGHPLHLSLIEFNNKYEIPRLARITRLIEKAQESSNQISKVLETAAQSAETQDELARERRAKTLTQIAVLEVTFLVFLAVLLVIKVAFMGKIVSASGGAGASKFLSLGAIDATFLNMLYFHAGLLQGFFSGMLSGYVKTGEFGPGLKWAVINIIIVTIAWGAVM